MFFALPRDWPPCYHENVIFSGSSSIFASSIIRVNITNRFKITIFFICDLIVHCSFSGLVATCNYISNPKASRNGMFLILFILSGIKGQSSAKSIKPGGKEVVVDEYISILNHLRRRSQYRHYDKVMSSSKFLSMYMLSISFASPRS